MGLRFWCSCGILVDCFVVSRWLNSHNAARDFEAHDTRIVVIGNGSVLFLEAFQAHVGAGVSLYTDPSRQTYRALKLVHGFGGTAGLGMIRSGLRAWKGGFRQGRTQGDPLQQGAFVAQQRGRCGV